MDYEKAYKAVLTTAKQWIKDGCTDKERICLEHIFPELRESEDERIRKAALRGIEYLEQDLGWDAIDDVDILNVKEYLEKQKEQKPVHTAKEIWEDMRLEVYQQASGNRHEPNYSDDTTKIFSLCDIDEIFEKITEKQGEQWPAERSEDERIRKELIEYLTHRSEVTGFIDEDKDCKRWIAYLEKQKAKEKYDRMAPIYSDQEPFECALEKAWKFYNDSGSSTVDGCEDNPIELSFAKGFREGFLCKGKQKEQKEIPNTYGCFNCTKWEECKRGLTPCSGHRLKIVEQKPAECIEASVKFEEGFKAGRESGLRDGQKYVLNNLDSYGLCKPAEWSEEDEKKRRNLMSLLVNMRGDRITEETYQKYYPWLKSLLERFNFQPKQKWSEEDEEIAKQIEEQL